ncbi:nucleoside deaminase [Corynebacterium sp. sy017]|uniref:nucleoside deaminase n=1 Tax=unclassified Corynebacterium TaxID=2624378 RepID=UPI001184E1C9|nr:MULTISPECIES: nucleoside deaminase [unclassified Corynebacterium]MBP3088503.1 nucleoside deaminase [Corynebacterium sp. sy017]QDZ41924.1 nucleoside deaminase [Corynebacterium sp. sy039]TSD91808.1 nucleoside deaminase [Corynebacterium sp. SY003]
MAKQEGCVRAEEYMRKALALARTTNPRDVPVGAHIYAPDGTLIGQGVNRREIDSDPLAHAEMLAIRQAVVAHNDGWRLSDCTLVVTLEPCTMCAGALVGARIGSIIFGAYEPKTGAVGSVFDVVRDRKVLHHTHVRGGVLEQECQELLQEFFRDKREV